LPEYQPRLGRLLKSVVGMALLIGPALSAGRGWMYVLPSVMLGAILVVHQWLLPKKGVNGWTIEPRDRYSRIMGLDSSGRRGTRR
jgi:hypothetical protein